MPKKKDNIAYVILRGYYSDRHILAVTLDKKRAKRFEKLYGDSYVQEYVLDRYAQGGTSTLFKINFCKSTGAVRGVWIDEYGYEFEDGYIDDYSEDDGLIFYVWATDEEHAKKIAFDRRAEILAKEAGVNA